jgi:hypothetical protein|tara:strand:+ start:1233 stop:1793 length:561 start_codon:yes stop_codon:yes gene_type:complete
LARPAHEQVQQLEFLLAQGQWLASLLDQTRQRVESEIAHFDNVAALTLLAPEQGVEPSEQFFEPDRLYNEIICSRIQPFDLVLPASPRRENQDRCIDTPVSPMPEEFDPVSIRQPQIEYHRSHLVDIGPILSLAPASRNFNREIGAAQTFAEAPTEFGIVFDKEQAHRTSLAMARWRTAIEYGSRN